MTVDEIPRRFVSVEKIIGSTETCDIFQGKYIVYRLAQGLILTPTAR